MGTNTVSTPLVASRRLRDGTSIGFAYDALGRLIEFNRPNSERSQSFEYDNLGRLTDADQLNASIDYVWDALGRLTSHTDGGFGTTAFLYDAAGRRTRMTWPDSFYVTYDYNVAGRPDRRSGRSGSTSLAAFTYDDRGRRTVLTRGNGTMTELRLRQCLAARQIVQNLDGSGTTNDLTLDFTHNPASQIVTNDAQQQRLQLHRPRQRQRREHDQRAEPGHRLGRHDASATATPAATSPRSAAPAMPMTAPTG